jgi:hypothetical protein
MNRMQSMRKAREEAYDCIKFAQFTMAAGYNNGRRISDIQVQDKVYINLAKKTDVSYTASSINAPKLGPQRVGPFLVTDTAGSNAVGVDIPADWKIWPVIIVHHLVKASSTPGTFDRSPARATRLSDESREIEEVLDVRIHRGRKQYFVKFVGLPITRHDWINSDEFELYRAKIEEFDTSNAANNL